MRPRKCVLVISPNESAGSQRVYQLHIWGFRSVRFRNLLDAIEHAKGSAFDAILMENPLPQSVAMVSAQLSTAIICTMDEPNDSLAEELMASGAHRVQPSGAADAWMLRDTLRTLTARKRGPKKGYVPARIAAMSLGATA